MPYDVAYIVISWRFVISYSLQVCDFHTFYDFIGISMSMTSPATPPLLRWMPRLLWWFVTSAC